MTSFAARCLDFKQFQTISLTNYAGRLAVALLDRITLLERVQYLVPYSCAVKPQSRREVITRVHFKMFR